MNVQPPPLADVPLPSTNKGNFFLWLSAITCCLAPFSFGLSLAFTSPVLPELIDEGILSLEAGSWFSSLMPLGAMVGTLIAGRLIDPFGRKTSLLIMTLPFSIGWLLILTPAATDSTHPSWSLPLLYLGRVLTGFGSGASCVITPTYLAEIAPAKQRGALGTMYQMFLALGVLFIYVLGLGIDWRWITVAASLPSTILVLFMVGLPESPRWLLSHDRYDDAYRALKRIRGNDMTTIYEELDDMRVTPFNIMSD